MSSCRMMRRREAPSESRIPISRWRETPRASSRLATLAQPIIRTSPKAKKIGAKASRTRHIGRERALSRCQPDVGKAPVASCVRSGRPDAQRLSPAVAAVGDIPGFSRPTTSTMAISSSLPAYGAAELRGERERRPVIGRADAEPAKVLGHDADDLVRHAVDAQTSGRSLSGRPRTVCAIPCG